MPRRACRRTPRDRTSVWIAVALTLVSAFGTVRGGWFNQSSVLQSGSGSQLHDIAAPASSPRARGWGWPGAPGSTTERTYRRAHVVRAEAGGISLPVRREIAPLVSWFVGELVARGYGVDRPPADDWGFANRDVRGRPGVKSNHAWGLSFDLNATRNPMTHNGRVVTDLPADTARLAAKYGFRWGGSYKGTRKDPMHFEFLGTPADAHSLVVALSTPPPAAHVSLEVVDTESVPGGHPDRFGRYPYWAVAADGGIFAFNGAPFLGSLGGVRLNAPVVGMAATPSGRGYWLVAADGGIFAFGDAPFPGSFANARLAGRITGIQARTDGVAGFYVTTDAYDTAGGGATYALP